MQNFPQVLSEYEDINFLLYKPINATQRIKYTCFSTSANYIVLGSTSGSLYLFSRESCLFLQLIPLSEGAVSHVLISPDEKTIALATVRGSICLVALRPTPKLLAVSTEHVHEEINCLCWNENSTEIYIGDGTGKVSVMVLSIFTVNGMFQAPACVLMHLDSAIVQLNFSSSLLLVSTLTRCYICNTVQEQYKQIGNKARNGEFGACFYKISNGGSNIEVAEKEEKLVNRMRSFSLISEGDNNIQEESSLTIFCARPGSRLWEVSVNGTVIKTHQFKEALAISPSNICKPYDISSSEKETKEESWPPQSINFSHLFVIAEKYLFSYTSNGLYVINPSNATMVLWCNEFSNISMANVVGNKIYLMTTDAEFHCLSLSQLDSLLLWLYNKKRYRDCLNVCLLYKSQLYKLIDSLEITKICDIEGKLVDLQNDQLATSLHPIIQLLQSTVDTCPVKLNSGIVVVSAGSIDLKTEKSFRHKPTVKPRNPSEDIQIANNEYKEHETEISPKTIDIDAGNIERMESDKVNCNTESPDTEELNEATQLEPRMNSNQNIALRIQSDLEDVYSLANDIKPSISERKLEIIIVGIQENLKTIQESYGTQTELKNFVYEVHRSAELYYYTVLLENVSSQLVESTNSCEILREVTKAFMEINAQSCTRCHCKRPFPTERLPEPKFLATGRALLNKMSENAEGCMDLCNRVPYMLREYFPVYIEKKLPLTDTLLRQCLQTRDVVVLSALLPLLDTMQWSAVLVYLGKMKDGRCLFCQNSVSETGHQNVIDWSDVTQEIAKKQGPDIAMAFLTKVNRLTPKLSLDRSIFRTLVFTKILHQHGIKQVINFNRTPTDSSDYSTLCSSKIRDHLTETLEKDLGRTVKKTAFGNGAHHWGMRYQSKLSVCSCCTLSLQTPVLLGNNGIAIFNCGHAYHVNCMIEKKLTKCILHS